MSTQPTTNPLGGLASIIDPGAGTQIGQESSLSNWVGPYVTDMLGKAWAWSETPYDHYGGPLTAGPTTNQQTAFQGIGNLAQPGIMGQAGDLMGAAGTAAQNLGPYQQQQFGSQYQAPGAFQSNTFQNQYQAPGAYQQQQFGTQYQSPDSYQQNQFSDRYVAPEDYQQQQFGNQYQPINSYQQQQFGNQYESPDAYQSRVDFQSQYETPENLYQAGNIGTEMWNNQFAQQYMNPFVQQSLNPQLLDARRQAEMTRMENAGRLAQAGAFGGSRQAVMEAENNRNMADLMAKITGEGYNRAYDTAGQLFTSDMARDLQAQTAQESARQAAGAQGLDAARDTATFGARAQEAREASDQFGYGQSMAAADLRARYGADADRMRQAESQFGYGQDMAAAELSARYGTDADRMRQAESQFGYGQKMTAADRAAGYGIDVDRLRQGESQFGYGQEMTAADLAARYGIDVDRLRQDESQFGYGQSMTAADLAARFGQQAAQDTEASRQFGYGQSMTAADLAARYGLDADRLRQGESQFGAKYGLDALNQQLAAGQAMGNLGNTQFQNEIRRLQELERMGANERGITQEGISADYNQFMQERDDPYNKLLGMQNFLQDLPLQTQSNVYQQPSLLGQILTGAGAGGTILDELMQILGGGNN